MTATLGQAHQRLKSWLDGAALPFWSTGGCDPLGHGFVEHLTLDGNSAEVDFKRLRVQARQIYVFSHGFLLGWTNLLQPAASGFEFILSHALQDAGSWARRLGRTGGVKDCAADLYDIAFVLFALAWYARAVDEPRAVRLARDTVHWLTIHMRSRHGGFYNCLPREPGARQQNPHMHLLEACLALFETSGDDLYAELAEELITLFRTRLFDAATGTLGEFFAEDWSWAPDASGNHVEPGHHYEWVWLLREYQRLIGGDLTAEARALYDFANRFGADPATHLVYDVVGRDGAPRQRSSRLWSQTEAIKAHLAMRDQVQGAEEHVAPIIDNLMTRYFAPAPRGTWIDQLDAEGRPRVDKIPSSSFYHIFMAYAELDRAVSGLA